MSPWYAPPEKGNRLSFSSGYLLGFFNKTSLQSYIPTGLIVAISWVSFWIDRRAVPARVSLSFTTLLTLSTQGNGIRYTLPPVSYAKAIDYFYGGQSSLQKYKYYLVCMLFIFGVLLEFTLVNSYMRRANKYSQMAEKLQTSRNESSKPPSYSNHFLPNIKINHSASNLTSECDGYEGRYFGVHTTKSGTQILMFKAVNYSRKALFIDKTSRYAFPCKFNILFLGR